MFSKKSSHEHCWHPENRMEKTLETISFIYKNKQSTSLDGLSGNFVARRCYRIWDMLWYCNDLILTFNQKHQKKWEVSPKPTPFKRVGSPQWPCCLVQDFQCWVQVCRDDCEARTQAREPLWEAESCWSWTWQTTCQPKEVVCWGHLNIQRCTMTMSHFPETVCGSPHLFPLDEGETKGGNTISIHF